jgi:hypothetical protein
MSPSDKIALASVIATAVVALGGFWINRGTAKDDREARAAEAERERLLHLRLEANVEAAAILERIRMFVDRTVPLLDFADQPEPPDAPPDEEWWTLGGRLAVTMSPAVHDAFRAALDRFIAFQGASAKKWKTVNPDVSASTVTISSKSYRNDRV